METEGLIEHLKQYNSSSFRQRLLKNLIFSVLRCDLLSHEEKRKQYYECMAAYYSVDHSNLNEVDAREEQDLVKYVEIAFVDAMNQRELTESEKEQIKRKRFLEKTQYEQIMGDFRNDRNWIDFI